MRCCSTCPPPRTTVSLPPPLGMPRRGVQHHLTMLCIRFISVAALIVWHQRSRRGPSGAARHRQLPRLCFGAACSACQVRQRELAYLVPRSASSRRLDRRGGEGARLCFTCWRCWCCVSGRSTLAAASSKGQWQQLRNLLTHPVTSKACRKVSDQGRTQRVCPSHSAGQSRRKDSRRGIDRHQRSQRWGLLGMVSAGAEEGRHAGVL